MKDKLIENNKQQFIIRVCNYFNISYDDLFINQKNREDNYLIPRYVIWYFLKLHTKLSIRKLGMVFNKSHASVLHGLKAMDNLIETDKRYKSIIQDLECDAEYILTKKSLPSVKRKFIIDQIITMLELCFDEETARYFLDWYKLNEDVKF